ncbi:DUF4166 domain-containing protein [Candidatus Berkiella aquae]|uniref:DUF4166 domain-containing protein n=1 Tax=Candidatus Berkiella aquae TaxID=295108 RepID=A0A0Q9YLS9_9GAMM|nr:DUF4166 domain-containing protein [Candidatus Berkiella aquae]MCS5710605.1 DUF4166 domain-containing protein [Candidatus Berkiella aquae]
MVETSSIFQQVFAQKWQQLPPVFQRHYNLNANSHDRITVTGTITVNAKGLMKWLGPIMGMMGLLPPKPAKEIPITVTYACYPDSNAFHLERIFHYPDRTDFIFNTKMILLNDNIMVDLTRCNVGWKFTYDYQDNQITLSHQAFVFKLGKWFIPLPIEWLLGHCNSYEIPVSDNTFKMAMQFKHPWFGILYEYFGTFHFD